MANLSGDDRGQIILVAAFALAVIFVALALIVNSAIFTENLASRGETAGSNDALSTRAMVETNVGDALTAANRNDNSSVDNLTDAVNASVRNYSAEAGRQSARSGRVVDVESPSYRTGQRIYQSNGTTFENASGNSSYVVARNVSRVEGGNGTRAFGIVMTDDNSGFLSYFNITAQQTGATSNSNSWHADIWYDGSNVRVGTIINTGGDTFTENCAVEATLPVTIDITGGTIAGEECDALGTNATTGQEFHFATGTGVEPGTSETYDIRFGNADLIEGNFSMVVANTTGNLETPATDNDIQSSTALYGATVRYTYLTTDLRYETDVRVAPGEPDA